MTIDKDTTIRLGSAAAIVGTMFAGVAYISGTVRDAETRHSEDVSLLVHEINDIGIKVVRNEAHLSAAVSRLDEIATSLKSGTNGIETRIADHELRIIRLEAATE